MLRALALVAYLSSSAMAGAYYSNTVSTNTGTAALKQSGTICVAASSQTPDTCTILLNGATGDITGNAVNGFNLSVQFGGIAAATTTFAGATGGHAIAVAATSGGAATYSVQASTLTFDSDFMTATVASSPNTGTFVSLKDSIAFSTLTAGRINASTAVVDVAHIYDLTVDSLVFTGGLVTQSGRFSDLEVSTGTLFMARGSTVVFGPNGYITDASPGGFANGLTLGAPYGMYRLGKSSLGYSSVLQCSPSDGTNCIEAMKSTDDGGSGVLGYGVISADGLKSGYFVWSPSVDAVAFGRGVGALAFDGSGNADLANTGDISIRGDKVKSGGQVYTGTDLVAIPTFSGACGSGALLSGTDMAMQLKIGTGGATSCTIGFYKNWASTPICVISPVNNTTGPIPNQVPAMIDSTSVSGLVIVPHPDGLNEVPPVSTFAGGERLNILCLGRSTAHANIW